MDKHVFGFPGGWVNQWFKFDQTWVIGLSGCRAVLGILSTNNPVIKVSGLRPSALTTGLLVLL